MDITKVYSWIKKYIKDLKVNKLYKEVLKRLSFIFEKFRILVKRTYKKEPFLIFADKLDI